jgi:hypothetical protein
MSAIDHLRRVSGDTFERSATPHADLTELALADFKAKLAHRVILPGREGTSARLQLAIISAAQRAIAAEQDGAVKHSDIALGLIDALASLLASHLAKYVHEEAPAVRVAMAQKFLATLAQRTTMMLERLDELPASYIAGVSAPNPHGGGTA